MELFEMISVARHFAIGSVLGLLMALCLYKLCYPKKKYNLPPGLPSYPLIGNVLDMAGGGEVPDKWWQISQERNWPIMSFKFPNRASVVISSPEIVKEMLITKGSVFNSRDSAGYMNAAMSRSLDGRHETGIIFTPHGSAWRKSRKILVAGQNEFRRTYGDDYVVKVLLPQLYREMEESADSIDARTRVCKQMVTRIVAVFVFGPGAEQYADAIWPLNDELFQKIDANNFVEHFTPVVGSAVSWLFNKLVTRRVTARKQRLYEQIISERGTKYNQERKWSLTDMVQEAEQNGEITHQQGLQIYEECFLGSQDTTMAAIEGALQILVENHNIQRKVQQEMDHVLGVGTRLRHAHVEKLPYFQAVIKEALRLHRAIPILTPHVAHEDATLAGYDIPEGTILLVNLWGLARDPKNFPEPLAVKPERFLDKDTNFSGTDCQYVVFGVGQRICPGQMLALLSLHILVGSLAQRYDLSLATDWKHERESGSFFRERALQLSIKKRF